jgi:nucleoside-diphosphate-sugar epimerase
MKNILIIGGSYFAGRVCVEELVKQPGVVVYVFNRGRQPLNLPGVIELRGDREDPEQLRSAIPAREWAAVIDFCAYTPSHVEALLENLPGSVAQYIFISTTTVLKKSHALPATEEGPILTGPQSELGPSGDYGYDKVMAEKRAREICTDTRAALTILRPAIIYGYYNYAPRETYFFNLLRTQSPFVIPIEDLALFSFIWVVDMAHLIIRCIGDERTYAQTFNLASDEFISYLRIIEVLEEITGKSIKPTRMPAEDIDRRGIPLPFPLKEHLLYSGAKIQRLFDFSYTPFKRGIREALKYYLTVQKQKAVSTPP